MRARDIAFIRKLCSLGLPAPTLAQSLLPALRDLIGAHSGAVFWVDDKGDMQELYAERMLPPEAMARYYERHYATRSAGFAAAFRQRALDAVPVSVHSFDAEEQATSYFEDVMRPLDAYHVLYGILRDGARAFGQISLYRGRGDKPFTHESASVLQGLLRYLSAGLVLRKAKTGAADAWETIEEAIGVVSSDAEVIHASAGWQRLLRLAALPKVSPGTARDEARHVREFLEDVCAGPAPKGVQRSVHENANGRFVITVYQLAAEAAEERRRFGMVIRHEEPRSLALVRATAVSDLSPQQREVALLLAQGRTNPEIAEALGFTLNTAGFHVKQVYEKLQVNDRYAVAHRLIELASAAAARERTADAVRPGVRSA